MIGKTAIRDRNNILVYRMLCSIGICSRIQGCMQAVDFGKAWK